jgi:hypothetical protein
MLDRHLVQVVRQVLLERDHAQAVDDRLARVAVCEMPDG